MFLRLPLQAACAMAVSVKLVSAGIYGTNPVASTVMNAGRMNPVRWIDDGTTPTTEELGPINIDLYAGPTYVTTLASGVDAKSLSADVWISPSWRHNGSDYHIEFVCKDPSTIVYTADFTITGMSKIPPLDGPTIDSRNGSAPSLVYDNTQPTLSPTSTVATSTSSSTTRTSTSTSTSTNTSTSTSSSSQTTSTTPPSSTSAAPTSNNAIARFSTIDIERLKFQFVFVFWPTLIGISMAL